MKWLHRALAATSIAMCLCSLPWPAATVDWVLVIALDAAALLLLYRPQSKYEWAAPLVFRWLVSWQSLGGGWVELIIAGYVPFTLAAIGHALTASAPKRRRNKKRNSTATVAEQKSSSMTVHERVMLALEAEPHATGARIAKVARCSESYARRIKRSYSGQNLLEAGLKANLDRRRER